MLTGLGDSEEPADAGNNTLADVPAAFTISTPRAIRRAFCTDVLVADRFAFAEAFPEIPCDRATIDDYLQFALQGTAQH